MWYTGKVPAGLAKLDADIHFLSSFATVFLQEHRHPRPSLMSINLCSQECMIKGSKGDFKSLCERACCATFNISWLLNRHHECRLHVSLDAPVRKINLISGLWSVKYVWHLWQSLLNILTKEAPSPLILSVVLFYWIKRVFSVVFPEMSTLSIYDYHPKKSMMWLEHVLDWFWHLVWDCPADSFVFIFAVQGLLPGGEQSPYLQPFYGELWKTDSKIINRDRRGCNICMPTCLHVARLSLSDSAFLPTKLLAWVGSELPEGPSDHVESTDISDIYYH